MAFDFAEVLRRMVEAGPPTCTSRRGCRRRCATRARSSRWRASRCSPARRPARSSTASSTTTSANASRTSKQLDFAYAIPGVARFRVNCFFQRGSVSAAFRLVPQDIPALDSLGVPQVLRELGRQTARLRPRHRPDRLGQVDDPGGDDRRDQRRAPGPHPHDRGPDRVPAPAQTLDRQPARGRLRRARLRPRPARRPARGPRRDPGRRDARPGDDLHRADRGRDRPPRLRHPAHPVDRADGRPDHRRLPAPAAGAGAHPALDRPAGDRHPAAAADRRRDRAASSPPRCWCRRRRSAT